MRPAISKVALILFDVQMLRVINSDLASVETFLLQKTSQTNACALQCQKSGMTERQEDEKTLNNHERTRNDLAR